MTKSVKASALWHLLLDRIPLQELQATRINPLQVERQTYVYNGIVFYLENLLSARAAAKAAKEWLVRTGSVSKILDIPYYEFFAGYAAFHLLATPATAQALISALYSEYISWGFDSSTLLSILALQNITL